MFVDDFIEEDAVHSLLGDFGDVLGRGAIDALERHGARATLVAVVLAVRR